MLANLVEKQCPFVPFVPSVRGVPSMAIDQHPALVSTLRRPQHPMVTWWLAMIAGRRAYYQCLDFLKSRASGLGFYGGDGDDDDGGDGGGDGGDGLVSCLWEKLSKVMARLELLPYDGFLTHVEIAAQNSAAALRGSQ